MPRASPPGPDRLGFALVATFLSLEVLAVWIPEGLSAGPRSDIWVASAHLMAGQELIGTTDRPLWPWIHAFAHWITPDSYAAHQVLMALLFLLRGLVVFALARRLFFGDSAPAFLLAAIAIFHPADRGWFILSHLSLHLSLTLCLVSVWLLLHWLQESGRWQWPLAAASAALALWNYEGYFGLLVAAPCFLPWWTQAPRSRYQKALLGWLAVPAIYVAWRTVLALRGFPGYAAVILDLEPGAVASRFAESYARNLWPHWRMPLVFLRVHYGDLSVVRAAGVLAAGLVWLLVRRTTPFSPIPSRDWAILAAAGVAGVAIGFAPYAATTVAVSHARTAFLTSLGASLAVVAALALVTARLPWRGVWLGVVGGYFVALATANGIWEHHVEVNQSRPQQRLLASIVERAPAVRGDTLFLLVFEDAEQRRAFGGFTRDLALASALRFVYGDPSLDALSVPGPIEPVFEDTRVLLETGRPEARAFALSRLVVFACTAEEACELAPALPGHLAPEGSPGYRPQERILDRPVPERACRLLHASLRPVGCAGR